MTTSIQALREQKAALAKQANHILDSKPKDSKWTKEDQVQFDNIAEEMELVDKQISTMQRILDVSAEENFKDATKYDPKDPKNHAKAAAREVFAKLLRHGQNALTPEEHAQIRNTMSTTTPSEGGYTVQSTVSSELIDLLKSYSFMRRVAAKITTANGGPLSYPSTDGTAEEGEIVAQNVQAASADLVFGTRDLSTYKFSSKTVAIPMELIQDSTIDIVALVYKRLRDRIGRTQNKFFTTGTGVSQPTGLVTAASAGKVGATGQTLTVIYDDLVDLVDSLDAAYLDNPESDPSMDGIAPGWMFSQAMRRVLRKLKDTSGRPIWTPGYEDGITAATPDRLLGYPVYINNDMPAPAASAKSIAFGNLHRYMIRDALDISLFRFDDSAFVSKGQIGFLGWARAGGNLMDINSVKLYQHSAT